MTELKNNTTSKKISDIFIKFKNKDHNRAFLYPYIFQQRNQNISLSGMKEMKTIVMREARTLILCKKDI